MPHTSLSAARNLAMGTATCPVGPVIRILAPCICRSYAWRRPPSAARPGKTSAGVEQVSTPIGLHQLSDERPPHHQGEQHMSSVLVTGAGRGIGRAITEEFIRRGHRVIGTARNPESLADLAVTQRVALAVPDDASV